MRGTLVVYRREVGALFAGPLAWALLFVALLLNGAMLTLILTSQSAGSGGVDITATLELLFGQGILFWALMLVLPPLLAMRVLAEESASGTLEFLRTAPLSDAAVVLGKFLAALTFLALLWSSIFVYAAGMHLLGGPPDWGQVITIYIGILMVSGTFVALSLVPSAATGTPVLAAFLSFIGCLGWLLMPVIGARLLGSMRVLLADVFGGYDRAERFILEQLSRFDVGGHFINSYFKGVLDSAEVVFFLTWIAFFLFLTTRTLEARRWRG